MLFKHVRLSDNDASDAAAANDAAGDAVLVQARISVTMPGLAVTSLAIEPQCDATAAFERLRAAAERADEHALSTIHALQEATAACTHRHLVEVTGAPPHGARAMPLSVARLVLRARVADTTAVHAQREARVALRLFEEPLADGGAVRLARSVASATAETTGAAGANAHLVRMIERALRFTTEAELAWRGGGDAPTAGALAVLAAEWPLLARSRWYAMRAAPAEHEVDGALLLAALPAAVPPEPAPTLRLFLVEPEAREHRSAHIAAASARARARWMRSRAGCGARRARHSLAQPRRASRGGRARYG